MKDEDEPMPLDLPANCPLCGGVIEVTRLSCRECATEIHNRFAISGFAALPVEYQKFIVVFLRQRGSLKGVEKELGISYPTVNKMLETINRVLGAAVEPPRLSRKEILDAIEKGELTVQDATRLLDQKRKEGK